MKSIENFLARVLCEDIGKLILRLNLGFLMLFHGYKKYVNGIEGIKGLVTKAGLPEFLAYGVYLGEIAIPILLIIGLYTRISSLIYALTMFFAIYLAHSSHIFAINERSGALAIETPLLFLLGAVTLMFIGSGRIALDRK
ncbi:GntR family transcriptional regulator [Halarcobacter mediterraneus]|uniref:GntR family transcriptional regulator n=1 Tax=Halarcobacter mediterraneus TaxID=2023153 RepID=A0A4Q1B4Q4_9BACT|nr:DoxX family protein [Halarcobacter mediterraneus]RXK13227.1 GntR family transcriptional regulator [Halarcobacter mediterraneus]